MSKVIGATVGTTYDKSKIGGSGLTAEQQALLERIAQEYADREYTYMTATITPTGATYEMGSSQEIKFSWEFSHDVSSVTLNGEPQAATKKGSTTVKNITKSSTYEVIGTRADGKHETAKAKSSITFSNRFYRGYAAAPKEVNSAFITGLTKGFASGKGMTFTANCPNGQHIWYAYPKRFGIANPDMAPSGSTAYFSGGFEEPLEIDVTNASGYTEKYYVYKSINTGLHQEIKFT